MIHPRVRLLAALALGLAAGASAQIAHKYVMPDGSIVYSDTPVPGGRLVGEVAPPPPPDPQAVEAARQRADEQAKKAAASASERVAAQDAARKEEESAAAALEAAKRRLREGTEPLPGERTGVAGGGARLNEAYWARQRANEQAVAEAQARFDKARAGR